MNKDKVQQEALKLLLKSTDLVKYYQADQDTVCLILHSLVGYMIPRDELRIGLAGVQRAIDLTDALEEAVGVDGRLIATDEYRIGGTVRKYKRQDGLVVYVQTGLLKNFDHCELYQVEDGHPEKNLIVVTETGIGADEEQIVGFTMPYRIKDNEE